MSNRELYEAKFKLHMAKARNAYLVEVFGDTLAQNEGYKDLTGFEAIHYYLMQKHNWSPTEVSALNCDDLRLALTEEMQGWTAPKEAVFS